MTWPWIVGFIVLWAAVLVLMILMIGVLRRISPVLEQAEQTLRQSSLIEAGLAPGSRVGQFTVWDADGVPVTEATLLGEPSVVVFVERGCQPCDVVESELSRLGDPGMPARVLVVTDASAAESVMTLAPHAAVLHDAERSATNAFSNTIFPYGFAIDASGTVVAKGIATSIDAIRRLAEVAARDGRSVAIPDHVSAIGVHDGALERHERR